MSKNRLVSGRAKKKLGNELSADRYNYLDVGNAEPDLGLPSVDNSVLIGAADGSRTWADITTYANEFKGFTGSQGEIGYTGSKGVDGQFGGASFYYIFESDIYAGTVPDGYLRLDDSTTTLVTFIALADTDRFNSNIGSFIQTIDDSTSDIKGYIKLTDESNPVNFAIFAVTGEHTTHDDHFHIPVSYVSGATSVPLDDTNVIISFIVNGDKGDTGYTGSQGDIGFTGSQGDLGFTGSQGEIGYTGSQGQDGFNGTNGINGFTGSRGNVGFTGSAGVDGAVGYTGSQGVIGFTGSAGYTGSQGYTGSKGESSFTWGPTPPSSPEVGDRWYDTNKSKLVVYVDDGDSLQWVETAASGFLGRTGYTGSAGTGGGSTAAAVGYSLIFGV